MLSDDLKNAAISLVKYVHNDGDWFIPSSGKGDQGVRTANGWWSCPSNLKMADVIACGLGQGWIVGIAGQRYENTQAGITMLETESE
jgi:hypothetical protein